MPLGVCVMEKSMSYIYILLLYIYVTSPQVLRIMNRSDGVFNNSLENLLYFYSTTMICRNQPQPLRKLVPLLTL